MESPSEFLPLSAAGLYILAALSNGERHGYEIMREVETLSDGAVRIGPSSLYSTIKRLVVDGLIEESDQRPSPELDDSRRRYYRVTILGEQVLAAEVQRISRVVSAVDRKRLQVRLGEA